MGISRSAVAAAALAVLLGGGVLAGCSGKDSGSPTSAVAPLETGTPGQGQPAPAPAKPSQGNKSDSGKQAAPGKPSQSPQPSQPGKASVPVGQVGAAERKLTRTARLALAVPDVAATAMNARQLAKAAGGFSGEEREERDKATLTLAVPGDRLDQAVNDLARLGEVTTREQSAQDVTEQVVDLNSRVATQRASVDRVRALLDRATSISEITSLESELTQRESELESMTARRDALAGQVAMSTINLSLKAKNAPPEAAVKSEDTGFLAGLDGGWTAFVAFGAGALQVLGATLPFLALIAIPIAAFLWWRKTRKTRPTTEPTEQPS